MRLASHLHHILCMVLLILYSINLPYFIFWLPVLLEILDNICYVIIYCPFCDVINKKIELSFLIKPFFFITKMSGQKRKYVKNKKSV